MAAIVMALHPSPDYLSDLLRRGESYEQPVLAELVRRLRDTDPGTIIDVGAMLGTHSLYLAEHLPRMSIAAFEPWPPSRALLRRNVESYPNVRIYHHALADFTGHSFMRAEPENVGHAFIGEPEGVPVGVRTLDSFSFHNVRLIKIDVEGWEPLVLRGAWRTLNRWHPLVALEDWTGGDYARGLPDGYELVAEWERAHQMFLYAWRP